MIFTRFIKTLSVCCFSVCVASLANADLVILDLPTAGASPSGSSFATSVNHSSGAMFDVSYTLFAAATDESTVDAFINSTGPAGLFGVGSVNDPNAGNQRSIDADDGEMLTISGFTISEFNANGSGLSASDFNVSFNELSITAGTANNDAADISFTAFGTGATNFDPVTIVDLTALSDFSTTATDLFVENGTNNNANNRWSIDGISVDIVANTASIPEPSTATLLVAGMIGLVARRRR